nr:MAG TPA: hypothetical protein [Caudoviricetes sp.]
MILWGFKNFKNGIFRTEEGGVLESEQYLPPFKIKGGISVHFTAYSRPICPFVFCFCSLFDNVFNYLLHNQ